VALCWWGFPSPQAKSPLTAHVRNTASSYWKPWLKTQYRCLVPVASFGEPDRGASKQVPSWCSLDKRRSPFFLAGIWRPWAGPWRTKANPVTGKHLVCAFLGVRPHAEVAPVHKIAMPVTLTSREVSELWLMGFIPEALALQQPAPDGTLKIVATEQRKDGLAAQGEGFIWLRPKR
jgi:putative SOS response-associated peptidase YedK